MVRAAGFRIGQRAHLRMDMAALWTLTDIENACAADEISTDRYRSGKNRVWSSTFTIYRWDLLYNQKLKVGLISLKTYAYLPIYPPYSSDTTPSEPCQPVSPC